MSTLLLKIMPPCKIETEKNSGGTRRVDEKKLKSFFVHKKDLAKRQGCYVFAIEAPNGGALPWYIGKATKSFEQECFTNDKIKKYNDALFHKAKIKSALIFFITTEGTKVKISAQIIDEIETYLIMYGKLRNKNLINKKKIKIPAWGIQGVVRSTQGKPKKIESNFKTIFGI